MRDVSGQNVPLWDDVRVSDRQPLRKDEKTDVCVIGAGIAGLSVAYHLAKQGKSVVVLEDGSIGGGQTHRTTAHLVNVLDDRYYELERMHGRHGARLAAESHTQAIDSIERIATAENIACDFQRVDGYLFVAPGESDEILHREHEAAESAGIADVSFHDHLPYDGFPFGPCLRFKNQGQFHPEKYLMGLAAAIEKLGGKIFTQTHAKSVQEEKSIVRIETKDGGTVTASAAVVATNSPINDRVAIHTKQAGYLSYVIGARVPRGSIPTMLLWDTGQAGNRSAYHYVRLHADPEDAKSDILIVGGEDHRTGQANDAELRYARLEAWTRERFPMVESVAYRWSGQVLEPVDGMAFIGRNPGEKNVYIVTGDSGNGMTHGALAGILVSDLIRGRQNPWESLYDPARKTLSSVGEFASENLNTAWQYADWLRTGDVSSASQLGLGEGGIVRQGLTLLAVYRDEKGKLYELSAVCPHLGGIVRWNADEKTWDCPCHGSRFECHGKVIQGPANVDLPLHQSADGSS